MSALGCENLICIGPYPSENNGVSDYMEQYQTELRGLGYKIQNEKIYFLQSKWSQFNWIWLSLKLPFRQSTIYLIQHTPTLSGPLILMFLGAVRVFKRRAVIVSHEPSKIYEKYLTGLLKILYRTYEKKIVEWSTHFIVHTKFHQQQIIELGVFKTVHIIPLPIYNLEHPHSVNEEKKQWGFYGQISPKKGLDLLLKAIQSRPPGFFPKLNILGKAAPGNDQYVQSLKNSIGGNYQSHIVFSGYLSEQEKNRILPSLALIIYPYQWASQSAALSETCFYEIPYLASNLPFFKEFHEKYQCGWLFEAGSMESLLRTIEALVQDGVTIPKKEFQYLKKDLSLKSCALRLSEILQREVWG